MQVSREDVAYLALEGGGGKGVTYLGAIRALEAMGILPIDINRPGENQIIGISGASAGAITALLLGLGMNSIQIDAILKQSATFTGFFDGPSPGTYRLVDARGLSTTGGTTRVDRPSPLWAAARAGTALLSPAANFATKVAGGVLLEVLLGELPRPMAEKIRRTPEAYLNNLLLDRGLFPGFAPRRFFQQMLTRQLDRRILAAAGGDFRKVKGAETIGFQTFFDLTGVDLVITGVNVTKRRPAMFSRRLTPEFPVADAVAISMSLPVIFKPARVDVEVPITPFNSDPSAYQGFWVDGGVLNNLPLHAFDANFTVVEKASSAAEPLNPQIVALRLTPGEPDAPPPPPVDPDSVGLGTFLASFADAVMFPSEEGQVRTESEAEQTIDLFTFELETAEFAPSPDKTRLPIEYAREVVLRYFNPGLY